MNLKQWLSYIETIHNIPIDMSLDRVQQVAAAMQLLPFKPFTITIAGTNGKGTTAGFLEQAFSQAGYHVGTMASPHLLRFNERIRLDGQEVDDEIICQAFVIVEQARCSFNPIISLSYFEFVTLAGLYIFTNAKVDLAILEVGMGGRLDAVNIVDPNLAIITNIALDHTEYLGADREAIGREKAGILRPKIPVIYGEPDMPLSIAKGIEINHNKLYQFGKDYDFDLNEYELPTYLPTANAANAIQALKLLQDSFPVAADLIHNLLKNFSLPGRWQTINKYNRHIFDVAHNPHGVGQLKKFLLQQRCEGKTIAIFSMLKTKDIQQCVEIIKDVIDCWYLAPIQQPLALAQQQLVTAMQHTQVSQFFVYSDLPAAYAAAIGSLNPKDQLVIFGSFHTVAEIWPLIV